MIKAILVDDEPINIGNLTALLAQHCPQVEVIASATSADQAKALIVDLKPDVVFLDIQMPEKNGFDLLKSISEPGFEVVFVTAFDEYGVTAIKFSALDYLLKPINVAELKTAVNKVEEAVSDKRKNSRLENLLQLLDRQQLNEDEKIALPTQKETFLTPIKDIVRCESSNNYTTFFLTNGHSHLISRPIYEYDELLAPYGFIRCHQSHLVNKKHVRSILNEDSGYLVMDHGGIKIPISRQKKALVKSLFKA